MLRGCVAAFAGALGDRVIDSHELVSDLVGVVHKLDAAVAFRDDPGLFQVYAQVARTAALGAAPIDANAGGIGFTDAEARAAALGEAVERYAAAFVPPERIRTDTAKALGVAADVIRYRRYGPDATTPGSRDLAEDTVLDWVPAHDLARRRSSWVPAPLVYLAPLPGEFGHAPHPTSSGLAAAPDPWVALRGALLEVLERDAFMTTWLARRAPVARYLVEDAVRDVPVRLSGGPQSYELLRLPGVLDDVTVVLGLARGGPGQPAIAVGAAASCDPRTACRKAFREAQQTFAWAGILHATATRVEDAADITDLDGHVVYYLDETRMAAFDFLDCAETPAALLRPHANEAFAAADARRDVERIVAGLRQRDIIPFAVDVTTPELRQCGLWVIRAVVPQLYPLIVEHGLVLRGHPRLADVDEPNPDPHPFP
jgi:ribosomal protein S12 methylthiotransferase accessory factor